MPFTTKSGLTLAKDEGLYGTTFGGSTANMGSIFRLAFPPALRTQPFAIRVANGSTATFSVSATGTPLSYQWYLSSEHTAMAAPYMQGSSVQFAFVTDGGSGYASPPEVQFLGNASFSARATAVINNGMVTSLRLLSGGFYATAPTIQIDNPPAAVVPIPGQTNAALTISNVMDLDETNYFVVITNSFGSVSSAMVPLVIVRAPKNVVILNLGTAFEVQLAGKPGSPFVLQSTTNLDSPILWQSMLTNWADATGICRFTNENSGDWQKFYRLIAR
jgi:hypothetical protein